MPCPPSPHLHTHYEEDDDGYVIIGEVYDVVDFNLTVDPRLELNVNQKPLPEAKAPVQY